MESPRVLITGARSPAALEWARLAQRAGAEAVVVADSLRFPLAGFSSAATHSVRLPEVRSDVSAYGKAVCDVVREHRIQLVAPTCEEAFYISHQRRRIEAAGARVFVPPFDFMARAHHKYDFQRCVREAWRRNPDAGIRPLEQ